MKTSAAFLGGLQTELFDECSQFLQDEKNSLGTKEIDIYRLLLVDGERIILKLMLKLSLKICKFFLQNLK